MEKLALIIATVLCSTLCMAQQESKKARPEQPMSVEQITEKMTSDLGLSSKQTKKVKKLNEKYASVLQHPGPRMGHFGGKRPPKDGSFDKKECPEQPNVSAKDKQERPQRPQLTEEQKKKMEEMKAQRAAYEKELKSILTEEQYKKYQKMRTQRGGKGKFHKHGRPHLKKHNN